jgi:hypothetical protein
MLMGKYANQKPELSARQLFAIARTVLKAEATSDIADLSEGVKVQIARGGWQYPPFQQLTDVINLVMRDAPPPPPPPAAPTPPPQNARPLSREEAAAALAKIAARLPRPINPMPSPESELMTMRERYALVADIERLRIIATLRKGRGHAEDHYGGARGAPVSSDRED